MSRWQAENTKTGAFIICATEAMCRRAAAHKGWTDYTIGMVE